ncbi:hypothetical protein [Arthrobacter sp. H35-D1]|uniref:hypothetical protein n=1 Tax=Arthrobacter sp. H35-D1 TaxID=3046202 RepID=UPI0024BADE0A|nr:hypothetical protein [Arthrobacter sp. H35-D1]MDJ0315337.1 hypothetical protein [Arthrobacter sp. H35-D1]
MTPVLGGDSEEFAASVDSCAFTFHRLGFDVDLAFWRRFLVAARVFTTSAFWGISAAALDRELSVFG